MMDELFNSVIDSIVTDEVSVPVENVDNDETPTKKKTVKVKTKNSKKEDVKNIKKEEDNEEPHLEKPDMEESNGFRRYIDNGRYVGQNWERRQDRWGTGYHSNGYQRPWSGGGYRNFSRFGGSGGYQGGYQNNYQNNWGNKRYNSYNRFNRY